MKLINGNSLVEIDKLEANSANIVVTSPPYNMNLRIRNGKYCSRQIVKEISTKYENFDDNLPMEEYLQFNRKIINSCLKVAPLIFYNVQFLTGNKVALFKLIGEYAEVLKEIIIWDKVNAQPAIGELVMNSQYEVILVLDRDNAISRKFVNGNFSRGTLSNHWHIKRGKKAVKSHGATFPIELVHKLIDNFSKVGDTVSDPFMGTGTTGIVCKELNREFIGIEIDRDYFEISKKRIGDIIV